MEFNEELLPNFDKELQHFYLAALSKELNILNKKNAENIKLALLEVVRAYTRNFEGPPIRFDSSAKRCAYVLKHSPCFTSAVVKHMLRLVRSKSHILDSAIIRGVVNVCCLGGGPASDAVAVGKILSVLYEPYWLASRQPLCVRFTILDVNEDWETTGQNIVDTFREGNEILDVESVEVSFKFLKADLTETLKGKGKKAVQDADILTMVYFLSAVNRGRENMDSLRMVKDIMSSMKAEAVLFFLDSATELQYRQMACAANLLGNMDLIYGPRLEEFHTLSLESMKTFLQLYKKHFAHYMCLTNCFVSSGAWVKNPERGLWVNNSPLRSSTESCVTDEQLLWRRRNPYRNASASELTLKMLVFRSEVQKLLATEFVDENVYVENEFSCEDGDDGDEPWGDLRSEHFQRVPVYFFQSKSKKKRIFTGVPLSL